MKTIEELIRINEQFETARDYSIEIFEDYIGLTILYENNTCDYELEHREFEQLQDNFYVEGLNKIILATLDKEFEEIEINPRVNNFPIKILLNTGETYFMNFQEHDFILEALLIQQG